MNLTGEWYSCLEPIMKPSDDFNLLSLRRIDDDTVALSWETARDHLKVSVYRGLSPDTIDTNVPVITGSARGCERISGLPPGQGVYFRVVPQGGRGRIIGERRLPLEGTVNFRDLGGYAASDGRRVRWGRIYRSDNFSRLTDASHRSLANLGIKLVCDFRSAGEAASRPDRLPDDGSIAYLHLPVTHGSIDGIAAFERIKQKDISWFSDDFMRRGYLRGIDDFAGTWGNFLNRLAETGALPAVFHCSAGKDRAGIAAALVLLALGVPEETVIADHQLSNTFVADALDDIFSVIRSYGVDPHRLAAYFAAPRDCIRAVLGHIRKTDGSVHRYLVHRAGVKPETLEKLRSLLLTTLPASGTFHG